VRRAAGCGHVAAASVAAAAAAVAKGMTSADAARERITVTGVTS